jgi:hypothetical protein
VKFLVLFLFCLACCDATPKLPVESPSEDNSDVIRLSDRTAARYFYFGEAGVTATNDFDAIPTLARVGVFVSVPGQTNVKSLDESLVWAVSEDDEGRYARVEPRVTVAQRAYITQRSVALGQSISETASVLMEATPGSDALEDEAAARAQAEAKFGGPSPFESAGISPEDLMRKRRKRRAQTQIPEPRDFGLEQPPH